MLKLKIHRWKGTEADFITTDGIAQMFCSIFKLHVASKEFAMLKKSSWSYILDTKEGIKNWSFLLKIWIFKTYLDE